MNQNDWIKVEDMLPEDYNEVLTMVKYYESECWRIEIGVYYHDSGEWSTLQDESFKVTHWQPLPTPPQN